VNPYVERLAGYGLLMGAFGIMGTYAYNNQPEPDPFEGVCVAPEEVVLTYAECADICYEIIDGGGVSIP
jgi:hypothetical protein